MNISMEILYDALIPDTYLRLLITKVYKESGDALVTCHLGVPREYTTITVPFPIYDCMVEHLFDGAQPSRAGLQYWTHRYYETKQDFDKEQEYSWGIWQNESWSDLGINEIFIEMQPFFQDVALIDKLLRAEIAQSIIVPSKDTIADVIQMYEFMDKRKLL